MIKKKITFLNKKISLANTEDELTPDTTITPLSAKGNQTDESDTGTPGKL